MIIKSSNFVSSRRQFLKNVLPAGTLFCFGCSNLLAMPISGHKKKALTEKHKFLKDSGMTAEEVFKFAYQESLIPLMQKLGEDVGREKLIAMLKKASSANAAQQMAGMVQSMPKRDFATFKAFVKDYVNAVPYNLALVFEIVEDTDKVYEVKHTECLFAKTFRAVNAADIGYATQCYPSDAMIHAFNPKIKVKNPKNLMKGDDVCIERFVWEG